MKKSVIYTGLFVILYLFALFLWTLPLQESKMPYGEVDAVSHFIVGDYTAQTNKPITNLPFFIDKRYGKDNSFKPGTLWYPPPYHMNFAIAQIFGGERFSPIFLVNAIQSTLIIIAVFFVISKLFGFWPGFLSSLLLVFSTRDINIYLWGQWPERMAFAFVPLILYCIYQYFNLKKPIYIYVCAILAAINLFIHPMVFFHSVLAIFIFLAFLFIKEKKLNLNYKAIGIALVIFFVLIAMFPSQIGNVLLKTGESDIPEKGVYSRLFSWYQKPIQNVGLPDSHFSYKDSHHGYWTLPLVILGLIFLIQRRQKKDLLLLAWLVSLYIMLHLDIFGMGRPYRSLSGTAHIFYPMAAIGLFYLISFFGSFKKQAKYALVGLFIILVLSINLPATFSHLKQAYPPITRISAEQYEAALWIQQNIPESEQMFQMGQITQAKSRWMWMISNKVIL